MKQSILFFILLPLLSPLWGQVSMVDPQFHWESTNHKLELAYSVPWSIVSEAKESKRMILGLMIEEEKISFSIELNEIPSMSNLSDNEYFSYTRNRFLNLDNRNKLLFEGTINLLGKEFNQQVYKFYNHKWGLQKAHDIVFREKGFVIAITYAYPVKESNLGKSDLPSEIVKLIEKINFSDK